MATEHGGGQARFWTMSAAMLIAVVGGAALLLAATRPLASDFLRTFAIYVVYADAFALVAVLVAAWPLGAYLSRLGVPSLPQALIFAFAGCFVAVPFAIAGLFIDGSPAVGIFGLVIGAWSFGVGRLLYAPISRSRAAVIVANSTLLAAGALGTPIAVLAFVS